MDGNHRLARRSLRDVALPPVCDVSLRWLSWVLESLERLRPYNTINHECLTIFIEMTRLKIENGGLRERPKKRLSELTLVDLLTSF
jgi:hypothetical protein